MCGLYIIQRVCEKVVEKCPWLFGHAPDKLKTQKICKKAVEEYGSWLLRYVPNDPRFQGIKSKKKKKKDEMFLVHQRNTRDRGYIYS